MGTVRILPPLPLMVIAPSRMACRAIAVSIRKHSWIENRHNELNEGSVDTHRYQKLFQAYDLTQLRSKYDLYHRNAASMASPKALNQYPPVLSVKQVAEILAVSQNTAYALVRSKKIHSIRVGRSYRIPLDAVIKYLNDC